MTIAYGIFSGGLDSMLAARTLKEQGIEVRLLTFITPFFNADRAKISAGLIDLATRPVIITPSHLEMMEDPKHGFGRFANPCIDCHALMFNHAGKIMEDEGGDFLFSGEVLGQRPKSQTRRALDLVANESGYKTKILRPLSALVLPPTAMEEEGLVIRSRLLGFSGRTRKPQMDLAASYGITEYPTPAGGCLLTDPIFSIRLKELMAQDGDLMVRDVELLKWGRHFRLPGGAKLVVGRNKTENESIQKLKIDSDHVLKVAEIPGPTVVFSGGDLSDLELAAIITVSYSDVRDGEPHAVRIEHEGSETPMEAEGRPKNTFVHYMVT